MTPEQHDIDALDNRQTDIPGGVADPDDARWLQRAAQLYADSTDYYESSLFNSWNANLAHFRSEHAPGSKYTQDAYRHRSHVFRPKPRAAVRTLEATAAAALFSNDDLLSVEGVDPNNTFQAEAARLHQAMLQHRLETAIPWFLTVIGAYQDTHVYGVCISRQYWDYRVKTQREVVPATDEQGGLLMDEDGLPLGHEEERQAVVADKPAIDLIAPENFRFDPACDWREPIETSPYLIEVIPMYAGDVMAMMEGEGGWREYTLGQIVSHGAGERDTRSTVRDAREGKGREDATDVSSANEYSVVWIHFNIIRDTDEEDWAFYTVGTGLMLTDPAPLKEVDPLGRERYRVGFSSIEAHRAHPSGTVELNRPLTEMINDVTNQRLDNVKLVLNKRYAIRRGAKIDLGALMRNIPGGGVMMDDVTQDYKIMETPDVTSSSYQEQDRLAVEADELLGTFSQASVQSNRSLNETVGGMNLMASGANQVQELGLRTFIETWVEPVLRTLIKLEGLFETDEAVLALAAGKAEIAHAVDDNLLLQDLVVRVNVGMGNTNPQQKLARFLEPLNAVAQFPEFIQEIDFLEVGKEVFALAGQGDGARFMLTEEKKQQRAEAAGEQQDPRILVEQMRAEIKQLALEQAGILKQLEIETRKDVEMAKLAAQEKLKLTELYERLGIEREQMNVKAELEAARDKTARDIAALNAKQDRLKAQLKAKNLALGFDTFG